MFNNIGSNSFLLLVVMVFVAVLLLLEGLYLLWKSHRGPDARKVTKRLRALSASLDDSRATQLIKQRLLSDVPVLERYLLDLARVRKLDKFILQAGLGWTVSKLILLSALTGSTIFLLMLYVGTSATFLPFVAALSLALAPWIYVAEKRRQRLKKFEIQLPEALDLISRALRSGHAFPSALKMVGDEMPEPIAGEFSIVHDEVNFGVALQQALTNMSVRIPSTDLRYFIVSVLIQRDSGGNLTEVLGNLSRLIRERLKLAAKVRVLTSEGRMSAWILGVMPFALAGLMNLVNPEFMSPLWTDPIGISILQYTLVLMAFGIFILARLTRVRF